MKILILNITTLFIFLSFSFSISQYNKSGFVNFITVSGDKLMDGKKEFRFISYNIPNLFYVEDDMRFEQTIPFRFPDDYEIKDALLSIKQSGGQVVRTYVLSVRRPGENPEIPRHILGPAKFNEQAFVTLDKVLAQANEIGVRLIIPFVDNWIWWGGREEHAAFRGKDKESFWTDDQIISDFKKTIDFVLNRINSITGIPYKNDKAILAWETGNELQSPISWTSEIVSYIKILDPNHLVIDGFHSSILRPESIENPNIDIVTTHHYQKDADQIIDLVLENVKMTKGKKPYLVGEFGFIDTEGIKNVLDAVIQSGCSGALIWSLRPHNRDGGFYWHSEPYGGNLFKAYHWPGFSASEAFDEINCVNLIREKAFEIQSIEPPPLEPPDAPLLLPISNTAALNWQGSTGAGFYSIERSESAQGPWCKIANNISDADVQYHPLYNDNSVQVGKSYFYRIFAHNSAGSSPPSNIVQSSIVDYLSLVDECADFGKTYKTKGNIVLKADDARKSKEDTHRFLGKKSSFIIYECPQPIYAFNLYTFLPDSVIDFHVSASADGKKYNNITLTKIDFAAGAGEYDYFRPILFQAGDLTDNLYYLKIKFPIKAELARVEINYGKKSN